MAIAEAVRPTVKGKGKPRIAPPVPARSDIAAFREVAADVGISLMPWQETCGRYLTALAPDDRWLYREVAIVVARQNGKTTLLVPLIIQRLRAGQKILHTAQNRDIPREVFGLVADILSEDLSLFPQRNGRATRPRFANGQEEIRLANGGSYSIVAPTRGGARGKSGVDLVIVDELREMDTWDFISAAKPTLTASRNPQIVYLSNAGEDDSVVLNAVRDRAGKDPSLAYLEWSASPERPADDAEGWAEANPAMGNEIEGMGSVQETLQNEHRSAVLSGTLSLFEVEHLCRWVKTTREVLVQPADWNLCEAEKAPTKGRKVYMAVSMDPSGLRASAAIAWQGVDRRIALRMLDDISGSPIDVTTVAERFLEASQQQRVLSVGFDPMTDGELAKYFRVSKSITGSEWANASSMFVNLVETGRIRWYDAAVIGDDLTWTARKEHDESGKFLAVRANDDRPITAALAAIRAVWLASGKPVTRPRIY
jgi:hypothetical protein